GSFATGYPEILAAGGANGGGEAADALTSTGIVAGLNNDIGSWTTTAPSCGQILSGGLRAPVLRGKDGSTGSQPTIIKAEFTPNYGLTLEQAANACSFLSFDWQQTVVFLPGISPDFTPTQQLTGKDTWYNDPPPGGWTYCDASGFSCDNAPFY